MHPRLLDCGTRSITIERCLEEKDSLQTLMACNYAQGKNNSYWLHGISCHVNASKSCTRYLLVVYTQNIGPLLLDNPFTDGDEHETDG